MSEVAPTSSTTGERQTGTVAKWLNHRGIGFITPDGQETEVGKDLLVHYSQIKQGDGFKSLARDQRVEFEITTDPKNPEKLIAVNVTSIGGGDCVKEERRNRRAFKKNLDGESNEVGMATT